jgi:type IV pilus assembly protein PilA
MLTRIMKASDDRERGFTLIELLVVVVIIGILAGIAIPLFFNQRNAARDASVEADLRNIATVMETYYTQNDAYPTTATQLIDAGAQTSEGNSVTFVVAADGTYALKGCNSESTTPFEYDSGEGGFVTATFDSAACPTGGTVAVGS